MAVANTAAAGSTFYKMPLLSDDQRATVTQRSWTCFEAFQAARLSARRQPLCLNLQRYNPARFRTPPINQRTLADGSRLHIGPGPNGVRGKQQSMVGSPATRRKRRRVSGGSVAKTRLCAAGSCPRNPRDPSNVRSDMSRVQDRVIKAVTRIWLSTFRQPQLFRDLLHDRPPCVR
jgi:hypothetical protein